MLTYIPMYIFTCLVVCCSLLGFPLRFVHVQCVNLRLPLLLAYCSGGMLIVVRPSHATKTNIAEHFSETWSRAASVVETDSMSSS